MKKSNKIEFIEKANYIHPLNKYNYDKFIYINCHIKSIIYCNDCNKEFLQNSNNHINGTGCPYEANNITFTLEKFIEKVKKIHPYNKYDYSKFIYVNNKIKSIIICNDCSKEFSRSPNNHIRGDKCPYEIIKTLERFIFKANTVHHNKYDYSKFIYTKTVAKSIIICKDHGEFLQNPNHHLRGQGCPFCNTNFQEDLTKKYISTLLNYDIIRQNSIKVKNHKLRIDFKFQINNILYMIEYNGIQHYEPRSFGGISKEIAQFNFIKQQSRDEFVRQYCKDNNIILIEIDGRKYKNEKIKEYLIEKFKELNIEIKKEK